MAANETRNVRLAGLVRMGGRDPGAAKDGASEGARE